MKVLLVNKHPFISKMVSSLYGEENLEIVTSSEDANESFYEMIIIDNGSFNKNVLDNLAEYSVLVYLCTKIDPYRSKFDNTLLKPFLPFRLNDFLSEIEKMIEVKEDDFAFGDSILDSDKIQDVKSLLGSYDESSNMPIEPTVKSKFSFFKWFNFKKIFRKKSKNIRHIHRVIDDVEIDIQIKKVS